jgi:hypothetical protein
MGGLTFDLAFFLLATFAAALVAGLAGFAFGLVAAAVWLHILTPVQTATLIIAFGVAVWKLRRALQWIRLWPFLLALRLFAVGLPILLAGTWLGLSYGRVDDAGSRKIVLTLLLVSGVALMLSLRQTDLLQWSSR